MIRLRATVSFGRARQVFDLEAEAVVIGREAEATLVLPMEWVAGRQVLIEADLNGGLRVRPGGEVGGVAVNGEMVPAGGVYVPRGTGFEVRVVSPEGEAAVVAIEQLAVVAVVPGRGGRWLRAELVAGGCVLVGALWMGVYLLTSKAVVPATEEAAVVGLGGGASTQPQELIELAARAVASGERVLAREALDRAIAGGASGPVVDALGVAIKGSGPATQPGMAAGGAEAKVEFEGRLVTVGEREAVLRQRGEESLRGEESQREQAKARDEAKARDDVRAREEATKRQAEEERRDAAARSDAAAREKAEQEQRALLAAAEEDLKSGKDAKLTELGRGAIGAAKDAVRKRMSGAELTFPSDSDDRVVVVFRDGLYTVRGFTDEWNQGRIPVRLFYLARVRPAGTDKWTVLGVELLK